MLILKYALGFGVICLASYLVGRAFRRVRLPTITGYLFTGALVGSFGLDLIPSAAAQDLRFVDEIALAVIAFVAGSELYIKELRQRLRPILFTAGGMLAATFVLVSTVIYVLTAVMPFTDGWGVAARAATALLGGAVLLALSPPSTIAVIKEVRAHGPFTRTALGVTVLMDVVIIVLFAVATSFAATLLTGSALDAGFVGVLAVDLMLAIILGIAAGWILQGVLHRRWPAWLKTIAILALGFGIYELAGFVKSTSVERLGFEIYIEPLLIAMIAGFIITNFTAHRDEFEQLLHDVGPAVYVAFFTITGLALKLDILWATLPYAVVLFGVRALGIGIGSGIGMRLSGEDPAVARTSWMAFITQAGIALGLAREVAIQFPDLGAAFATLIISVVVLNEIFGPLFLKSVLKKRGEAHLPESHPPASARRAVLFGVESLSLELARALQRRDWTVVVADTDARQIERLAAEDVEERHVPSLDESVLAGLLPEDTAAVVAMLPNDEDNLTVMRFAAERRGVERLVVRASSPGHRDAFEAMGAFVVDPSTAMVTLLSQSVLAPQAAALFLRRQPDRSFVQVRLTNAELDGLPLRDLRLPIDVLFLEISREGTILVPSGHTVLKLGDDIALLAEPGAAEELSVLLRG